MPPKTTKKTEDELLQEDRNNRAMAMEIAAATSRKVFANSPHAALEIYDRLERDDDGAALPDQRELIEHLRVSENIARQLGFLSGDRGDTASVFGVYDRVFGETLENKVDVILAEILDEEDDED